MSVTIGARELKARLGTYLRTVRSGKALIVTDRGRPVAELRPIRPSELGEEGAIAEMIVRGEATRASASPLAPFKPVALRGGSMTRTIVAGRRDRL